MDANVQPGAQREAQNESEIPRGDSTPGGKIPWFPLVSRFPFDPTIDAFAMCCRKKWSTQFFSNM